MLFQRIRKARLLMLSSAGIALLAAPAFAQSAKSADQRNDSSSASGIEDIVVTARKVEESQQSVPLAITAFSQDELDKRSINTPFDLQANTPGLQLSRNSSGQGNYNIRGQGQGFGTPPGVLTYFAGAPISNLGFNGGQFGLYDLQSVQVLKGPQGTLFGRTSTGGAVLFEPQRPTDRFEGFVSVQGGARNLYEVSGALNIPVINDVLAVRVAGQVTRQDGYTHSITTGQKLDNISNTGFRIGIKFTPTDWFENYTVVQHNDTRSNIGTAASGGNPAFYTPSFYTTTLNAVCGGAASLSGVPGNTAFIAGCVAQRQAILANAGAELAASIARVQAGNVRNVETSMIVENMNKQTGLINQTVLRAPDMGALTNLQLKNVFNLPTLGLEQIGNYEVDGTGAVIGDFRQSVDIGKGTCVTTGATIGQCTGGGTTGNTANQRPDVNFSEEVNLSGTLFDRFDFLAGYYYSKSINRKTTVPGAFMSLANVFSPTLDPTAINSTKLTDVRERGIFLQGTLDLKGVIDGLRLTGGYRWNKNRNISISAANITSDTKDIKGYNYTLSADYQATPGLLLYVRSSRAFKPGGTNQAECTTNLPVACPLTFGPEVVKDYEAGIKWDWQSGELRGRTNIAAFLLKDGSIQRRFAATTPNVFNYILNVAEAKTKGFEFEQTLVYSGLELSLRGGYQDSYYTKWWAQQGTAFPCTDPINNSSNNCADYSDSLWANSPKFQINLNAAYTISLGDAGELTPSINFYHQSAVNYADVPKIDTLEIEPAYSVWNARVDWNNVGGQPLRASLFVRNLGNRDYATGRAGVGALGYYTVSYAPPRTWGIELMYRFGQ